MNPQMMKYFNQSVQPPEPKVPGQGLKDQIREAQANQLHDEEQEIIRERPPTKYVRIFMNDVINSMTEKMMEYEESVRLY